MKQLFVLILVIFASCNLVEWNQKRLTKKYKRQGIAEKWFENEDHKIHYWQGGIGDTILIIQGFGGDAQVGWDATIRDLVKDYHVIAPDLLWFGQSTSKRDANLTSQVDAVNDLLTEIGVKKAHFVGLSYGGFVLTGMLYKYQDMIDKFCIVDSPGITYDISLLDDLCERAKVKSVDELFVPKNEEELQRLFDIGRHNSKKVPKGILTDVYQLYFSKNHKELTSLMKTLPLEQEKFNKIKLESLPETCVIWGEHDAVFPISEGKKLAEFMKAKFVEISDAGHTPNTDNFKVFQEALRAFLKQ